MKNNLRYFFDATSIIYLSLEEVVQVACCLLQVYIHII